MKIIKFAAGEDAMSKLLKLFVPWPGKISILELKSYQIMNGNGTATDIIEVTDKQGKLYFIPQNRMAKGERECLYPGVQLAISKSGAVRIIARRPIQLELF